MSGTRKIAAHQVISHGVGVVRNCVLTFDSEGVLRGVDSNLPNIDSFSGVEFYSGTMVPGFVNAHAHLELSYLKGKITPHRGLTNFVAEISAKRNDSTVEQMVAAADFQDSVMWSQGSAAVGDISNSEITFELKKRSKIYYHTFIEQFGLNGGQIDESLLSKALSAQIAHSLTPHSTYSLGDNFFRDVVADPRANRLSIHFMESRAEKELYEGKGALSQRFDQLGFTVDFRGYGSPARRIIASIPSNVPLLLIHNTFIEQDDIELIMNHFDDVVWVICPRSNHYIENTLPPIELLRSNGCRIAVGTDSFASNSSLSMVDEINYIARNYNFDPLEIITWATQNGAEALGMAQKLGSFELGKSPGAVLLDSVDLKKVTSGRRLM